MTGNQSDENSGERLRDHELAGRIRSNIVSDSDSVALAVETLAHLLKTLNLTQERLNKRLAADGLTLAKFNVLVVVWSAEGRRLPMSEVSERMSVTCANITKLVDGLERGGWVRRAALPGDRRVALAELTPEGAERFERIMGQHFESVGHLWGDMSADECLQLIHLTMKLRRNINSRDEG